MSRAPRLSRVGLIDEAVAAWDAAVADLAQREQELRDAEMRLSDAYSLAAQNPADLAEWQSLMNKTIAINTTLETIHSGLSTAGGWWDSFTSFVPGLSGYRQLGAAQFLLPVSIGMITSVSAGIVALVGSIGAFLTYIATKNDHLSGLSDDVEELRASGATEPQIQNYIESRTDAAKEAAKTASGFTPTADIVKAAMLAVVGIGIAVIIPRLIAPRK